MTPGNQLSENSFAAELRGFGPVGIIAILVIVLTGNIVLPHMIALPVGAALVLVLVRLSQTPWREIGYIQPKNWIITIAGGIVFGIAFKFLMKAFVMPLLGADPVNYAYHFLANNDALLPAATWAMLMAGFGEETVFRGYMFERMAKLFEHGVTAKICIVIFTSIWFGFSHYFSQGVAGVEQAFITGVVFGTIFATTGSIWFVMIAHAAFDLTALAIIYRNMENYVAHLIFK